MAQLVDNNGAFDSKIRLRTRGSWVQVLPGAPDNQRVAAMQPFLFSPLRDFCATFTVDYRQLP